MLKYKRCNKCKKKAVYILSYCQPNIKLCAEHAPKMANGEIGYKELYIVDKAPRFSIGEYEKDYKPIVYPLDKCFLCDKLIKDMQEFNKVSMSSSIIENNDKYVLAAVPVIGFIRYSCKIGYGCGVEYAKQY